MNRLSVDQKNQGAAIMARVFIKALSQDMYPQQKLEAVFGVKMEPINPHTVQAMSIGTIVFNVWVGLFRNQKINEQWIKKALLSGDLPKQFEKSVHQFMGQISKNGGFAGQYMPELIRRGFDKILWEKNLHNAVKLN